MALPESEANDEDCRVTTATMTAAARADHKPARCLFVPFSEPLLDMLDRQGDSKAFADALVPFQLEYECVRLMDGTFDFRQRIQEG